MHEPTFTVLWVDVPAAAHAVLADAGFVVETVQEAGATADAVVLHAPTRAALQALVSDAAVTRPALDSALLVVTEVFDDGIEAELLRSGVQDIVPADASLPRAIRHAVLRRCVEREARLAYATDLATGLPHEAQLLEHMTQLLALRERQPAPMVLIVLRIEGVAQATARLGGEAGNILRRKVAVRLRSGLRASDVVASIGPDTFGVLLGHLEAAADGERVASKLSRSLQAPLTVSGEACKVRATLGIAHYPQHGKDARTLMQRATAQAASVATLGSVGHAGPADRPVGGPGTAANDDGG